MRRLLRLSSLMALVLLTAVSLALPGGSARANDVNDPNDQHALGPYDQFACNGTEEDVLDTGDPNNSFFPPFSVKFNEFNTNNAGVLSGGYTFPFSDDEVKQQLNRDQQAGSTPNVLLEIAPTEPRPGDQVSAIAALSGFNDDNTSSSRQAAITFAVNDVSLQGILAGATTLPEGSGSACGVITRTPHKDADRDGMDDDWEVLHGLNPNDPSDAFADPDKDSASQFFTNKAGDPFVITPATSGGPAGVMNNLAEYDWGTDPKRPDTNKNGVLDGLEILGYGGQTVTFPNTFPAGEQFTVRAYAVGRSIMQDAKQEFTPLVKLDSTVKTIASSNGEHLRGQAITDQPFTVPGTTARVEAHFNGTVSEPSAFDYTYIVDGTEVTNPLPSRDVLEIPVDPGRKPTTIVPYELRAVNRSTGQLAVLRGNVRVGENVTLQTTPPTPAAGAPVTINAVLASGNDPLSYLYEWRIDGQLDEQASGVGKDSFTTTAPGNTGSTAAINVQLFAVSDGQLTGSADTQLTVATPAVTIQLVPAEPVAGNKVTGVAKPTGFSFNLDTDGDGTFDAVQLTYNWVVDGTTLPPDTNAAGISTVNLFAGSDGANHTLSVHVQSEGVDVAAATAQASFTTLPSGTAFNFVRGTRHGVTALTAAAISALPPTVRWVAAGVSVVGLGLLVVVLNRRRREPRGRTT